MRNSASSSAAACASASDDLPVLPNWIEVDLAAIRHNVALMKRLVGPDVEIIGVVKASAYGHGAGPVAKAVLRGGACRLAVINVAEAAELRKEGIEAPIIVMLPATREAAGSAHALGLELMVCDLAGIGMLAAHGDERGERYRVHLKLDTGMCRYGAACGDVAACTEAVLAAPSLELIGVCSHLATSEDPDGTFCRAQIERFTAAAAEARRLLGHPLTRHLANSAAAVRFPEARFEAVRIGLSIYGLSECPGVAAIGLRPALTWRARVLQVRQAKAGETISYGQTYTVPKDTRVAVVPVGYADGYPRALSNRADMLVHGRRAPVRGVVCMDSTILDVGHIPGVAAGDEVVVVGSQGDEAITANELAARASTIVYEIVSRLGTRPQRIYLNVSEASG